MTAPTVLDWSRDVGSLRPIGGHAGFDRTPPDGPLIVNVWAAWCAPCVRELPSLQALSETELRAPVTVIGLTPASDVFLAEELVDGLGIGFVNYAVDETGPLRTRMGVEAFPVSFLVDAGGRVIGRVDGYRDWSDPRMVSMLEAAFD